MKFVFNSFVRPNCLFVDPTQRSQIGYPISRLHIPIKLTSLYQPSFTTVVNFIPKIASC